MLDSKILIHCPFHGNPLIDVGVLALKHPIQMMEHHAETVAQILPANPLERANEANGRYQNSSVFK